MNHTTSPVPAHPASILSEMQDLARTAHTLLVEASSSC